MITKEILCGVCGKMFVAKGQSSARAKYHLYCRTEAIRRACRRYEEKRKANGGRPMRPVDPTTSLAKVIAFCENEKIKK